MQTYPNMDSEKLLGIIVITNQIWHQSNILSMGFLDKSSKFNFIKNDPNSKG